MWVDEVEVPGTTDDRLAIWNWNVEEKRPTDALFKRPMLQGPIDDGFKSRFILVLPDGLPDGTASDKWARIEADHFLVRWRSLMRGDAMVRTAKEVTEKDIQDCHLVVWGTPNTNTLMRKILASPSLIDVITWDDQVVRIGEQQGPSASSVPVLCFPNPLNPSRYVIVNSGLTFREVHDKTNSLQNPKLPDWAILDIAEPPSIESAGRVIAADFFDSQWKVQPRVKLPENRE